jgi:magnesium-transporting ATPase (P-type)
MKFIPFDPVGKKTMATVKEPNTNKIFYTSKGAPQAVSMRGEPNKEKNRISGRVREEEVEDRNRNRNTTNRESERGRGREEENRNRNKKRKPLTPSFHFSLLLFCQVLMIANVNGAEYEKKVNQCIDEFASRGLRSLAVARADDEQGKQWKIEGMLPLFDPPRHDTEETIKKVQEMKCRVKMITGDHLVRTTFLLLFLLI